MNNNIEEMEFEVFRANRDWSDRVIESFMEHSLNQHKDHIEKIAQLETQIAELLKKEEI